MRLNPFTILAVIMFIVLLLSYPTQSQAHIVTKKQCKQYALVAAVIDNPLNENPIPSKRRLKKCLRAAHTHLLTNGLLLPPILVAIRSCESGGGIHGRYNYHAENPSSTASGAFQFLDSTWNNHRGYTRAKYAPRRVQDRKALLTYKANGTTPRASSSPCWSNLL